MKRKCMFLASLAIVGLATCNVSYAVTITGGSATLIITEGKANGIAEFDAYFNEVATRAQTLADAAPGNAPFAETPANPGVVTLTDPIRPSGVTPSPFPGTPGATRSPQKTTLDIEDLSDVLGSWDTSNDAFAFVGSSTLGEQIAFTSMQRYTGPFTGALLYGDFGLRYTGTKLVLTSNIDFLNAAFADIGSPVISVTGHTLTITGDLLAGGGLFVLDPSATPGLKFGEFSMTARLVPEPSSMALAQTAALSLVAVGRRHLKRRSGNVRQA